MAAAATATLENHSLRRTAQPAIAGGSELRPGGSELRPDGSELRPDGSE